MSTYDPLNKIIPDDQALAFKAVEAGFKQIKGISDSTTKKLGASLTKLESNTGLPLINALTLPLPQNIVDFWIQLLDQGTGPNNTLVLCDVIGTPSGWIHNIALPNATVAITSLAELNAFNSLTNLTNGVYTVMENCLSGLYTTGEFYVEIPGGLPGAGTYGTFATPEEAQADAFTNGLNPALISALTVIMAAYPTQATLANLNFMNMAVQINRENVNLRSADMVFADLLPGSNYSGLVTSLPEYGLDINNGGAAYFFEAIANVTSIGGQAVISTMRESRNSTLLEAAGIQIDTLVSDLITVPLTNLSTSQYTVTQAASLKIV